MNLYNEEELKRISNLKDSNDRLEEFFKNKRAEWREKVEPLYKSLALDLPSVPKVKDILEVQSKSLIYRQDITDQINLFLNKRGKEIVKIKKLRQDKFVFYALGVGIKTNLGEKTILIDAHIAENDRCVELIESYVEFLRGTSDNLVNLGYSIKNMNDLFNYLGK
jgi:hypothetical protein